MSIIKNNYLKAFKINSGMMLEINRRLLQKLKNEGIIIKFKVYNHPKKIFNYNNKVFIDDKICYKWSQFMKDYQQYFSNTCDICGKKDHETINCFEFLFH